MSDVTSPTQGLGIVNVYELCRDPFPNTGLFPSWTVVVRFKPSVQQESCLGLFSDRKPPAIQCEVTFYF